MVRVDQEGMWEVMPRSLTSLKAWRVQLKMETQNHWNRKETTVMETKLTTKDGREWKEPVKEKQTRVPWREAWETTWSRLSFQGSRWYPERIVPAVRHATSEKLEEKHPWAGHVQPFFHLLVFFSSSSPLSLGWVPGYGSWVIGT